MRHLVKNMLADHLVTFTKAEGPATKDWGLEEWAAWESGGKEAWEAKYGAFMGPEEWAKVWDKFRRLLARYLGDFPYVAILEKHAKATITCTLHGVAGSMSKSFARCGLLLSGAAKGAEISTRRKSKCLRGDRASRIARYISKYVSKHFEDDPRYNKKRYWASRQTLEEARRYVLTADTLDGAIEQMRQMLGLDFSKFLTICPRRGLIHQNMFSFPDGSGFWLAYIPELHASDPPF